MQEVRRVLVEKIEAGKGAQEDPWMRKQLLARQASKMGLREPVHLHAHWAVFEAVCAVVRKWSVNRWVRVARFQPEGQAFCVRRGVRVRGDNPPPRFLSVPLELSRLLAQQQLSNVVPVLFIRRGPQQHEGVVDEGLDDFVQLPPQVP